MTANSSFSTRLLPVAALALLLAACGGGGDGGDGGGDTTPDAITPFSFTTVENATAGEPVFSNEVTLSGFQAKQAIIVNGGSYCLNLDAENTNASELCSVLPGTVKAGDKLKLMMLASEEAGSEVTMDVSVGNTDDIRFTTSFSAVTRPDTSLPIGEIVVPKLIGIDTGEPGITDPVVIGDFVGVLEVDAAATGVRFSIDGGAFVDGPVNLRPGQSLVLEVEAGDAAGATRTVGLSFSSGDNVREATVEVQARDPDADGGAAPFSFTSHPDADPATLVATSAVIEGQFTNLPITITGGRYSIGGENNFRTDPGEISGGETLHVQVTSSDQYAAAARARVTIGSGASAVTRYFEVTTKNEPADSNRPDPFSFFKQALLEPGAIAESSQIAVTGFSDSLDVTIDPATPAAAEAQFAVVDGDNVGQFTTSASITPGQKLVVRAKAPAGFGDEHVVLINVGEGADQQTGRFTLATRARDTQPATFSFGDPAVAEPNSENVYGPVTITGFDGELPVAVEAPAAAEVKIIIDGSTVGAGPTITANQTLSVQVKAPAPGAEPHEIRVIVGEGGTATSDEFVVSSQDVMPEEFSFEVPAVTLPPETEVSSGEVTVADFVGELDLNVTVNSDLDVDLTVQVNGEAVTVFPTKVRANDTIELLTRALPRADDEFSVDVSVGSFVGATVTATFTVITADVQPDVFSFNPSVKPDADPGQEIVAISDPLSGFVGALTATAQNGTFRVLRGDAQGPLTTSSEVIAGDVLELHVLADAEIGGTSEATVIVGSGLNDRQATLLVTTTDNFGPDLFIDFPTPVSTTQSDTITLTGRWTDNDRVSELRMANSTGADDAISRHVFLEDGTWQMTVPLVPGNNIITVTAADPAANASAPATVTVNREVPFFNDPRSVVYDQENGANLMYVLDEGPLASIVEVNIDTNQRRIVAEERVDDGGVAIEQFSGKLLLDRALTGERRLLLLDTLPRGDDGSHHLIAVNASGGEVTDVAGGFVSGVSIETGPEAAVFIIGKLVGSEDKEIAVLRADLASGTVVEFSRPGPTTDRTGNGDPVWSGLIDLAFDSTRDVVYAIQGSLDEVNLTDDFLYSINLLTGDRTRLTSAGAIPVRPKAISVDVGGGAVYIVDSGTVSVTEGGETVSHVNPILAATPDGDNNANYVVIRSNTSGLSISEPRDLLLFERDAENILWVADRDEPEGVIEIPFDDPAGSIFPPVKTGEGIAFDDPGVLTLDAANNRLLAVTAMGIQGVSIADGYRGSFDLFTLSDTSMTLGGLALVDDELWVTVNSSNNGLGIIPTLGNGEEDAPSAILSVLADTTQFGNSSDLLVEDGRAFVATVEDVTPGDIDKVQEITLPESGVPSVKTAFTSPASGGSQKHLFRFDETRIIVGDRVDLFLMGDDNDDEDDLAQLQLIYPGDDGVLQEVSAYAYDSANKRLYMTGRIEDGADAAPFQFGWVDLNPLVTQTEGDLDPDDREFNVVIETGLDVNATPGYPTRIDQLLGFELDGVRQRLFALGGSGGDRNEVVVINLMAVAVDQDGNPGFDCETSEFNTESDCPLVRKQTGETVLISRSESGR